MTSTITLGLQQVVPDLVVDVQTSVDVPTIVHRIIGRTDPDVTLQPAQLRSGTLQLLMTDGLTAATAVAVLSTPGVATLTDTDVPAVNMAFVVTGQLDSQMDTQDMRRWTVTVPYQEVTP